MAAQWYFAIDGHIQGPVSGDELKLRASQHKLGAVDLVWREGMANWVSAGSLGLAAGNTPPPLPGALNPTVSVAPPMATPPPPVGMPATPPAPPVAVRPKEKQTSPVHATHDRQPIRSQAANHAAWRFRAIWIGMGGLAILVCGFWIGHVLGTKSGRDGDERVAIAKPVSPDIRDNKVDRGTSMGPTSADTLAGDPASRDGSAAPTTPKLQKTAPSTKPMPSPAVTPKTSAPDVPKTAPSVQPVIRPATSSAPRVPISRPTKAIGPRTLFQTLEIHRKPTFVMSGMTLPQELRYRILSQLEVEARQPDGTFKVVQIVERTHLDHADELSKATFARSLKALERQQYTFQLNLQNEVIDFVGPKKNLVALPVALPTSKGFQFTSVIDEDGWKELAQLTFFAPDDRVAQGEPYVRQMSHDWGPLGIWSGTTTFATASVRGDLQSIDFQHALTYAPPKAKAAAGAFGFRVTSATCIIDKADGTIVFDRNQQRISSAREIFQVHGTIATEVLGQAANIEMQEHQLMTILVTDQRPAGN